MVGNMVNTYFLACKILPFCCLDNFLSKYLLTCGRTKLVGKLSKLFVDKQMLQLKGCDKTVS
jgi:hypothetical protein